MTTPGSKLHCGTSPPRPTSPDGAVRYIDIKDGAYTGISITRDTAAPLVDHHGRVIGQD